MCTSPTGPSSRWGGDITAFGASARASRSSMTGATTYASRSTPRRSGPARRDPSACPGTVARGRGSRVGHRGVCARQAAAAWVVHSGATTSTDPHIRSGSGLTKSRRGQGLCSSDPAHTAWQVWLIQPTTPSKAWRPASAVPALVNAVTDRLCRDVRVRHTQSDITQRDTIVAARSPAGPAPCVYPGACRVRPRRCKARE
jgi:hypothetical protein